MFDLSPKLSLTKRTTIVAFTLAIVYIFTFTLYTDAPSYKKFHSPIDSINPPQPPAISDIEPRHLLAKNVSTTINSQLNSAKHDEYDAGVDDMKKNLPPVAIEPLPPIYQGPLTYIPNSPEHERCWIITCADRTLENAQQFSAEGFRHIHLSMQSYIEELGLHPVWCRVGYLRDAAMTGQRCAIYADDDVFLNLTQLRDVITYHQDLADGDIIFTSAEQHGMPKHINAGFVVFTNLQTMVSRYVVETWFAARWQPKNVPMSYLKDQAALNRLVACDFPGVVCYDRKNEDQMNTLGLLGHCFSNMDVKEPGAKAECMAKMKREAQEWDLEGMNTSSVSFPGISSS